MDEAVLLRMLRRGDKFSVCGGLLQIETKSGKPVPDMWMKQIREVMLTILPGKLGHSVLRYITYSTGFFDVGNGVKKPGVSLQFECARTGQAAYVNFNAEITRSRTTPAGKKGTALPKGHFRVGEKYAFTKFWATTLLPQPRRLSAFHDYMGKLGNVFFVGAIGRDERIDKASLRPIELSAEQISSIVERDNVPDKGRTTPGQEPDNSRTRKPDKETRESQEQQRIQTDSSAGAPDYGNKVKGNTGTRGYITSNVIPIGEGAAGNPQQQSHEEWLADYGGLD